ncbi:MULTISPECIES: protein translocase subunit SecF [Acetobacteraceae]|uniref:Protein-export membrane protein SecF n=2 Tax=Acetobacteraceae TaxID=433 RepID=A0ABX4ZMX4_9PROT|nr:MULTISPECIES: protein translocase subunit SecF [Acetobacteraceae]QGT75080.1 protein translocase subunit SecF [Bombella sp. ESL0368]MBE1723280.1 protein translocase subunit SecF [Bombella apis]MBR9730059.1 protein translocase subunit SecF [Bombella apis]MCL1511312.1 protein translocase subunit SecF [Parasaccharibacter sp. TMW 2.1884]MCT6819123.1 protein translocase subunit SecF [Bombella apis]
MFSRPLLRFVRDDRQIHFMRGRHAGLIVSALLSIASVVLFITPGLNLGLDFRGGIIVETHSPAAEDPAHMREVLKAGHINAASVQSFGSPQDVRIAINLPPGGEDEHVTQKLVDQVRTVIVQAVPGVQIQRADAVGGSVSSELFRDGVLALLFSLGMILIYIWFRFEREFALSAVITLVLDLTKTIGFLVVTRFEFDLVMVAALLTILGYSTNDKVVVYDRIRENLRKYRTMPLRELLDLSINETLNRTLGTSMTVFLAALPLALFGGSTLTGFATVMLFGIVVGTSSSIFIAAPLLLLMGQKRLRKAG